MADKLRIRSNAAGDAYLYIENTAAESFALGSDVGTGTFNINTLSTANVLPDEATSNIAIDPGTNGDIAFSPHGTGLSDFVNGDVKIGAGNFIIPQTNTAFTEGTVFSSGNRMIHFQSSDATNVFAGKDSGSANADRDCTGIGNLALASLEAGSTQNTGIGSLAGTSIGLNGRANTIVGYNAGSSITDKTRNVIVGANTYQSGDGDRNVMVGSQCGTAYTGTENNNILIGDGVPGIIGENSILRIGGSTGSGNSMIAQAFIQGIHSVTPAGATQVVVIDASGQMGSGASSGGASDFVTDSGTATDVSGSINVLGNTEEIATSGAGATVTIGTTTNFSATANHSWDGSIIEPASVSASSDGATITFSVEADGGGDLDVVFSDGYYLWDTTPADTIALTAGTDTVPVLNYVYFLQSTKALTVSTVSWPATEFAPLALILCPTAALYQTNGSYSFHGWTDHVTAASQEGHIHDINFWIRQQNATWKENVAPTLTITPNGGAADTVIFTSTAGTVLQLHEHTFPAFTPTPDIYVINDSGTAYTIVTDLNALLTDSTGASMSGRYFTLVIWGVISQDGDSKLICNLPGGSYNNQATLLADSSQFADFSIPGDFKGSGFLIYEMNLRHQTAASGTWTSVSEIDLRGFIPNVSAGGALATTTEFADSVFRVFDDLDPTKLIALQAASITTANTRTITMCDRDLSLITPTFDSMTADVGDVTVSVGNVAITSGLITMPVTNDAIDEGAITQGGTPSFHGRGTSNIFVGAGVSNATFTVAGCEFNAVLGVNALNVMATNCRNNAVVGYLALGLATDTRGAVAVGWQSCSLLTTSLANTAVGASSLNVLTSGSGFNTAIGNSALALLATGDYNAALGQGAGNALTTNDSDNICIMNAGVAGDNNTMHLGTQGTGNGQIDTTFIAGIVDVAPTNDGMVIIDSAGQLGSQVELVMPENPAFLAFNSVTDSNVTGDGTAYGVDFDSEVFDQGGDFASDTFTAPITARYMLTTNITVTGITTAMTVGGVTIVTSNSSYIGGKLDVGNVLDAASGAYTYSLSILADMDAADTATVSLTISNGTLVADVIGNAGPLFTNFSGYLAS